MYYVKVGDTEKSWGDLTTAIWDAQVRGKVEGFTIIWNPKDNRE